MTILIQNLTNETKQIVRFGGTKLSILPNNFITFECTNTAETAFWNQQSIMNISKYGIKVVVDKAQINALIKFRNAGKLPNINKVNTGAKVIQNKVVEPTVRETTDIKDDGITTTNNGTDTISNETILDTNIIDNVVESNDLSKLSKAELQAILTEKGISFKKNYSVNTLISLIENA